MNLSRGAAAMRTGWMAAGILGRIAFKDYLIKSALIVGIAYSIDTLVEFSLRGHRGDWTWEDIYDVPPGGDPSDPMQKMPNWKKYGPWGIAALILWLIAENLDSCDAVPDDHPN